MKLSMVHLQIEFCNVEYNFNQIKKSYIRSVLSGSELVVFPEFALTGYCVLSSDITIEVIGCNTQSLEEFHILLHNLVKQYCVPMVIGSFAYNNHTDSGTVSAYYYIDKDNFQLVKEKKQHKKLSHPYCIDFKYGGVISKQFELNNVKFNTLICSETMDSTLVDYVLEENCDILLNPSAFGEIKPYVNYPIGFSLSNQTKFDNLLILTPNQTINTDKYNLGRTTVRKGNDIIFEFFSMHTTLIHVESTTYVTTIDYI
jgi:predicted amidohydrolase